MMLTPKRNCGRTKPLYYRARKIKEACGYCFKKSLRRQQLDADMRDEIIPKNILMIGPTGVGKTEIARRLAKLANSPFVKSRGYKVHRGWLCW